MKTEQGIKIKFAGPGHYWLSRPHGEAVLDLMECRTEKELESAVQQCVDAGSGEEDWTGWFTDKSQDLEPEEPITIHNISAAQSQKEIVSAVSAYVQSLGEAELPGENYTDLASRLGDDELIRRAEARWCELESGDA